MLDQELDLPTVAQWDVAWNADSARRAASSAQRPREVGSGEPDALGLFDMVDNVAEWCRDAPVGSPMPVGPNGRQDGERWTWRKDRHLAAGGTFRELEGPGLLWPLNARDDVGVRPIRAVEFSTPVVEQGRESQESDNDQGDAPPAVDNREGER